MKLCVVGTGYVGLVSGTCLASVGHQVACVDVDAAKVERINRGEPPIHEDGLEALLKANVGTRLRATTSLADAMDGADVALICVGTPFDGKTIDLSYVLQVSREIGQVLKDQAAAAKAAGKQPHYCAFKGVAYNRFKACGQVHGLYFRTVCERKTRDFSKINRL